nr:MAG TPA: hypothetical protein [Caudoviricetes sp.]
MDLLNKKQKPSSSEGFSVITESFRNVRYNLKQLSKNLFLIK